ncbi:MAG TPA: energy transducer TonB [Acidobacteriaceae bacterium]|nr:energy transducer TonB [Acidobacteriaceae bacterium]
MDAHSLPDMHFDPEPVGKPKLGRSVLLHLGVVAFVYGAVFLMNHIHGTQWGNQRTPGAISITMVTSAPALPLPQDQKLTKNVVTTQSPSTAPAPPLPKIASVPQQDAIPLHEIHVRRHKPKPKKVPRRSRRYNAPAPVRQYHAQYGEEAANRMPRTMAPTRQGPQAPVTVTGGSNGFNYPWYVNVIQRNVEQNWYTQEVSPSTPTGTKVYVTFKISRDGAPSDIRITQSSGYPSLDSSALRAVQRVENFGPLPTGYNKSNVSVEYTFTYDLNHH